MTKTPQFKPSLRCVEIVAFSNVQLLDVAGPLQVFASTNTILAERGKPHFYATKVVSQSSPIVTSAGLGLVTSSLSRHATHVDTLLVAGGCGVHAAIMDHRLSQWVAKRATVARRVASVCTGAFLLGAANLLNGKRVATHWNECDRLARDYPEAIVEADPIFIQDGKVWSSAGVTAGIDLALALVEADVGHEIAMAVARDLVMFLKRPGGQAQFSASLALQVRGDVFDLLHSWIADHLADDLTIAALAKRAGMSERTFIRRYRACVGDTPAHSVETLRLEAAREKLTTGQTPIKRVASRCGFRSEETMRRSFQRKLGVAPRDYRERFSAK